MADTPSTLPNETPAASEPTSPTTSTNRSALVIVFLVVFIDLFGFGIVLPLLPRYAASFLEPLYPGADMKTLRGFLLGLLMASFSAMQFLFAPLWGRMSDRIGRRPILLLGLAGSVVFYALFGLASMMGSEGNRGLGLVLLFVSRLGAGLSGATIGTAQAVIADSTSAQGRSRGMALIGFAFGIGFFFGPILGFGALWLFPGLAQGPGFLASSLSLVAFLLGLFLLPETWRPGVGHARRSWFDPKGLQSLLAVPSIGALVVIFSLSSLAFAMFEPTLALLTKARALGLSDRNNFLVFAYIGLVLALAQGLLYRPLARRVREQTFMLMGSVLMALGLAGVGGVAVIAHHLVPLDWGEAREVAATLTPAPLADFPANLPWVGLYASSLPSSTLLLVVLMLILPVAVTGFAFMVPSVQALISRLSDPARQGEVLGVTQSANAMARILGPFLGVMLYFVTANHLLPYLLGVCLLIGALVLTLRLGRV